jgi:hypothetical protein
MIGVHNRYRFLFWSLLICLTIFMMAQSYAFDRILNPTLFFLVLVFTVSTLDRRTRARRFGFWIIGVELVLLALALIFRGNVTAPFSGILTFVVLLTAVIAMVKKLINAKEVTTDLLFGALASYLLLGLVYSILMFALDQAIPEALFSKNGSPLVRNEEFLYFTFITYTTIGFGDIMPIHPVSQTLSAWIGVTGQIYNTVIIALLVGKHLSLKRD